MYLKLLKQKINRRQWYLQSRKLYCFIKDLWTLSRWPRYWTLIMPNFNWCWLCVGKVGCFGWGFCVFFYIIPFIQKADLKIQIIFLPSKHNLEKYFYRQHILHKYFPSSILKINLCTSRRTQLQQSFGLRGSFVILRWFFFRLHWYFASLSTFFQTCRDVSLSIQVEPVLSREYDITKFHHWAFSK